MRKVKRIYIDSQHGSYTRPEFRLLSDGEKIELMRAWFRERHDSLALGGDPEWEEAPPDQSDILLRRFRHFASTKLIKSLGQKLRSHGYNYWLEWTLKGKHESGGEGYAPEDAFLQIGSEDERRFRASVLRRLGELESLLIQRDMMGHNHPPDALRNELQAASSEVRSEIDALIASLASLRSELEKISPSVLDIAAQHEEIFQVRTKLRREKKRDVALDSFAKGFGEELGRSVGKVVVWGPLLTATTALLVWLRAWLTALGF